MSPIHRHALRSVLDANILIPAAPRDLTLRLVPRGLIAPLWSDQILAEVERNLVVAGLTSASQAARLINALRLAFPNAAVTGFEANIEEMGNHPEDRHVLAVAVHAHADALVTANVRHFPRAVLDPHGIQVLTPDDLFTRLYQQAPLTIIETIQQQSNDLLRPARSVHDVLASLAVHAPRFVEIVRTEFT